VSELRGHWETVYRTRPGDGVSWYRPHLETSLRLIAEAAPDHAAAILDAGAGRSTLADDLLARGYRKLTLVDLSAAALEQARTRLGATAAELRWLAADITEAALPEATYDVWHDRAVFHFLTTEAQRAAYLRQLRRALKPGGHLVLATFGAAGPQRCSGLDVMRYDTQAQQQVLGQDFHLRESLIELHQTPGGSVQPFQYGLFQLARGPAMCAAP
jgi:SAM-dependent methyltransferase